MCMGTSNWRAMAYSRSISPTFSGVTLPFSFTSTPRARKRRTAARAFSNPPGLQFPASFLSFCSPAAGHGPQSPPNSSFSAAV